MYIITCNLGSRHYNIVVIVHEFSNEAKALVNVDIKPTLVHVICPIGALLYYTVKSLYPLKQNFLNVISMIYATGN